MNSSMIGKIEKARRYTNEPERVRLGALNATFRGGNDDHPLALRDEHWTCGCHFFKVNGTCAHIVAVQRILAPMLEESARYEQTPLPSGLGSSSSLIGKVDKARRYAEEPDRLTILSLAATFHGSNDDHDLGLDGDGWHCACDFYSSHDTCAHIMAAQHILAAMLEETRRYDHTPASGDLAAVGN